MGLPLSISRDYPFLSTIYYFNTCLVELQTWSSLLQLISFMYLCNWWLKLPQFLQNFKTINIHYIVDVKRLCHRYLFRLLLTLILVNVLVRMVCSMLSCYSEIYLKIELHNLVPVRLSLNVFVCAHMDNELEIYFHQTTHRVKLVQIKICPHHSSQLGFGSRQD